MTSRDSSHDIAALLPDVDGLRRRCRALAVLESILGSDFPRYSYTRSWGEGEAAFMDDGDGNEWTIVFTADGAFIRVFDHESPMSPYRDEDRELWPGLTDGLPEVFASQLDDPDFVATAILWRRPGDETWQTGANIEFPPGPGPDGSGMLLILTDDLAARYAAWATDHYGIAVSAAAVQHVVEGRPLSDAVMRGLNPHARRDQIIASINVVLS
ncbi:hypothetical protein KIH74_32205 [Kineosporia sp. J2-2]|uniref:Uncharacterized protein n=1 Tax=Kineosporia corallincola TaxID=2835133 RepID=A0ABS5TS65_9ACTN|nr:hypothetical protein [Kineosporia corallincola]MBT0773652.1 hypothetical protein [Kineosporia corallincola]